VRPPLNLYLHTLVLFTLDFFRDFALFFNDFDFLGFVDLDFLGFLDFLDFDLDFLGFGLDFLFFDLRIERLFATWQLAH
tara:strand:- start:810 stop:1046 length:237 start_codon:yes stop_codon:yes gene_type:complete